VVNSTDQVVSEGFMWEVWVEVYVGGIGFHITVKAFCLVTMAKNTSSSAFRKIDVDQYNEDNYREEEQAELQSAPIGPDEAEVTALMNQYPFSNYKISPAQK
jgi:hypothetical protein